jgi:hypothetical protein
LAKAAKEKIKKPLIKSGFSFKAFHPAKIIRQPKPLDE